MKGVYWFLSILLVLSTVALSLYNIKNNPNFFETPVYSVINIFIAIVFAFVFVQRRADEKRIKDYIENQVNSAVIEIGKLNACFAGGKFDFHKDFQEYLLKKKVIDNKLTCIKGVAKRVNIEEQVLVLIDNYRKFEELIDKNLKTPNFYDSKRIYIGKYISVINSKAEEILLILIK